MGEVGGCSEGVAGSCPEAGIWEWQDLKAGFLDTPFPPGSG